MAIKRRGIDQAILDEVPKAKKKSQPSDALAALAHLGDKELKDVLRQRCKARLLDNIEKGEDNSVRSIEVLAKFQENDFLVHAAQQQQQFVGVWTENCPGAVMLRNVKPILDELDLDEPEPVKSLPPTGEKEEK